MLERRNFLKGLAATTAAAPYALAESSKKTSNAVNGRIIFFVQNNGFDPKTCTPLGFSKSRDLAKAKLPEHISPLIPYMSKMNVVTGLHAKHTNPAHSAYHGALGGCRGIANITIDHRLSQVLKQTALPHLALGMESLEAMKSQPTISTLSATGPGKHFFMHSNPQIVYQMLFGSVASPAIRKKYEATSKMLSQVQYGTEMKGKGLSERELRKYYYFVNGIKEINEQRRRLKGVDHILKKVMPKYDIKYAKPEFETDWHEKILENGIAMLKGGLTNVLTLSSGRGGVLGSYRGLGIGTSGHTIGHKDQMQGNLWVKIRQFNCEMMVKIIKELESVPEGNGTMMDNTLIVYTSCCGWKQHSSGEEWPFLLIGDLGGRIKTGQFINNQGKRPLNALYTTLLNAVGVEEDHFNLSAKESSDLDAKKGGPIAELLT